MKVYKFRGKSLETGKYVYGDLVHVLTAVTVDDALVDKDTVAQFIGYDCRDREVYDDDKLVPVEESAFIGTDNQDEVIVDATIALEKWEFGDKFIDYELVR